MISIMNESGEGLARKDFIFSELEEVIVPLK
jgi:hypothetical protein